MTLKLETQIREAHDACEDFNKKYPIGTRVRYWEGSFSGKDNIETTTRSTAGLIGSTAFVLIEGVNRRVKLSHIDVIPN